VMQSNAVTSRRHVFVPALVASVVIAIGLSFGFLGDIENQSWDWRVRVAARGDRHDPAVKILMIDQTSIDYFAENFKVSWPWPRSMYAPVVQFLAKAGAKGVAFDMLFTEPGSNEGDDEEFARALDEVRTTLPVVSALAIRTSETRVQQQEVDFLRQLRSNEESTALAQGLGNRAPVYKDAVAPIESILRASAAVGNTQAEPDADKIFRHIGVGVYVGATPILNLPFALFHKVHPTAFPWKETAEKADGSGRLLVNFHGPARTYEWYSIHAVIASWVQMSEGRAPDVPLEAFKDAYVFVGASAPALLDFRPVPFPGVYPGVEFNATVLDNLMHGSFYRKLPIWIAVVLGIAMVVGTMLITLLFSTHQVSLLFLWSMLWIVGCFGAAFIGWWVPMVVPLLGMVLVALGTVVIQYQFEGRQHRFIRNAFSRYVAPEVIQSIVNSPSKLALGGEKRELTILFSDIEGFTRISEKLSPADLVKFLNLFLSEMTTIILGFGGTLDKYQGDAIIAFWNAPLPVADHRRRAVEASCMCQRRLRELAPQFEREFGVQVRMRVGLHTGQVTVGNFGSSTRFNYTIIGDAANLASRLEGVNKVFGSSVMVSAATRESLDQGVVWRTLGEIRVVGREETVVAYEPLDETHDATIVESLSVYEDARRSFEQQDLDKAEALFSKLSGDPVSRAYLSRIQGYRRNGGSFTHIWNLTEK
jgi:adenylate cyclase